MKRIARVAMLALLLLLASAATALAYDFPSTNDDNYTNGHPYVNQVAAGYRSVTLEFVNPTNSLAFFEIRLDGKFHKKKELPPHPVVTGDVMYPGVSVDGRGVQLPQLPVVDTETFEVKKKVEVRLALGGERDWDFDWTVFLPGPKR